MTVERKCRECGITHIEPGMTIDGDQLNTDPTNWKLLSRALLPRLAGRHGRDYDVAPAHLKPTIMATAELEQLAADKRKART